jgi:hypothetical protein
MPWCVVSGSIARCSRGGHNCQSQLTSFRHQTTAQPKLFDTKKTVLVTGTSSGLGRATAAVLCKSGKWNVIMVRATPHTAPHIFAPLPPASRGGLLWGRLHPVWLLSTRGYRLRGGRALEL